MVFYAAFTLFMTLRTTSRRVFFSNMILKRSKSEVALRFSVATRFFPHEEAAHFSATPESSNCFRMAPVPAPRASLGITNVVRVK
jgi:hypothetical protein